MNNKLRLEGWLLKYYKSTLGSGFRQTWISFNPATCKLECFKNSKSSDKHQPIDSIDIRDSVLTINCSDELPSIYENSVVTSSSNSKPIDTCNSFRVISGDKVWVLEASSPADCILWLESLQQLRKRLLKKQSDLNDLDEADEADDLALTSTTSGSLFTNAISNPKQQQEQSSGHHHDHSSSIDHQLNSSSNSNAHHRSTKSRQNSTSSLNSVDHKSGHNSSTSSLDQQITNQPPSTAASRSRVANLFTRIRKQDQPGQLSNVKKCPNCKELEDQIITLKDDLNAVENEIFGNKEVIKVLTSQIESLTIEKDTIQRVCNSLTIDKVEFSDLGDLVQKECEIEQCKSKIKTLEDQIIKLNDDNRQLEATTDKLKKDYKLLEEMLQIKDQTVISLTNEIFDLEKSSVQTGDTSKPSSSFSSYLTTNSFPTSETYVKPLLPKLNESESEKLKDSAKAYQMQNQFLNREIIELNENKRESEIKIQRLEWNLIESQAKFSCVQSKLLSLLKEINHSTEDEEADESTDADVEKTKSKSIAQNESIKQLVQRLLDDDNSLDIPHSWRNSKHKKQNLKDIIQKSSTTTIIKYDELGFQNKITQDNNELDDLFDKDDNSKKQETYDEQERLEWKSKWDAFISTISNSERLTRSNELKLLLRSGVPQDYRPKMWRLLINMLIEHKKPANDPNYYSNLVKASQRRNYNPSLKQIELDLLRTLPNNRNFESKQCDGIVRLRRVLTAYSQRNPLVGYCQGMNRLAAVSLLFLSEEDSFWCLVAIIETIMPKDYYTQNLVGAHVDQLVLKDLIAEKLPTLHSHFEHHGLEINLFGWFLTCFIDNLPPNTFLRIWDSLLLEGSKVLFRFALAFFKYHEANLLSLCDMMEINQYLRIFGEKTFDLEHLCNIAFNELNPFPLSKIKQKREIYRQEVCKELEKLENLKIETNSDKEKFESQSD